MDLNMAVHQERPGIDNVVSDGQPRRSRSGRRSGKRISVLGVLEVEALGDVLHGLRHGSVVPNALALANDVVFVRVLVDGVGWLQRLVYVENEIHPGIILCVHGQVTVRD